VFLVEEVLPLATSSCTQIKFVADRGLKTFIVVKSIMSLPSRPRYFTPNEVCLHNTADDLWVSYLGKVYDLTPLCEKYKGLLQRSGYIHGGRVCNCEARRTATNHGTVFARSYGVSCNVIRLFGKFVCIIWLELRLPIGLRL